MTAAVMTVRVMLGRPTHHAIDTASQTRGSHTRHSSEPHHMSNVPRSHAVLAVAQVAVRLEEVTVTARQLIP